MAPRSWLQRLAAVALPVVFFPGCFDEPPDTSNLVFTDALAPGVVYEPFFRSKLDATSVDPAERYAGDASLRFSVPTPGEPGAGEFNFSGGAFTSGLPRDLSRFTALTFWARASRDVTLNSLGLANDNTGGSRYQTEGRDLPLTTAWTRFVIPIPAPQKLGAERGLLWLADGAKGSPPSGYRIWLDEVKFETLDATGWNPRPVLTGGARALGVTETYQIEGTAVTYTTEGRDQRFSVFPATFDYATTNPAAATVSPDGLVTATGPGTAIISATLQGVAVPQTVVITVGTGTSPAAGPPAPAVAAGDVISLYSDSYTSVPVDNYGADWSNLNAGPRLSEVTLGGNHANKYTDLLYAGIEFLGAKEIDATGMTHVHVDVWTHDGTVFKLKLVDFGADTAFGGGDDSEHELVFDAGSSTPLVTDAWVQLDVPLASFTGLTSRAHLAQVVISSSTATVYLDNLYFHR